MKIGDDDEILNSGSISGLDGLNSDYALPRSLKSKHGTLQRAKRLLITIIIFAIIGVVMRKHSYATFSSLVVSPQLGKQILFQGATPTKQQSTQILFQAGNETSSDLYTVDLMTKQLVQITNTGNIGCPLMSPDQTQIVYCIGRNYYLSDKEGTNPFRLYENPNPTGQGTLYQFDVQWSADGTSLLTSSSLTSQGTYQRYSRIDSKYPNRLTPLLFVSFYARVEGSPDFKRLLFVEPGGRVLDMPETSHSITSDSFSNASELPRSYPIGWLPDGQQFVYIEKFAGGSPIIGIAKIDGSDVAHFALDLPITGETEDSDPFHFHYVLSPNGNYVAMTAPNYTHLYVRSVDGQLPWTKLATEPGRLIVDFAWSPTSDNLAYIEYKRSGSLLYLVGNDGISTLVTQIAHISNLNWLTDSIQPRTFLPKPAQIGVRQPDNAPDLVIDSIILNPATPTANQTFTATVIIRNRGRGDARWTLLRGVFQPGDEVSPTAVPPIRAGQSITIKLPVTLHSRGVNQIAAITLDANHDLKPVTTDADHDTTTILYNVD